MADIDLTKGSLPFLLSGNGTLTVHAAVPALDQKLTPSDTGLLSADFGAAGDQAFTFGPLTPSSSESRLNLKIASTPCGPPAAKTGCRFSMISEGVNTIFAMFDQLVRTQTPGPDARLSSVTFTSQVELSGSQGLSHHAARYVYNRITSGPSHAHAYGGCRVETTFCGPSPVIGSVGRSSNPLSANFQ